MVLKQILSSVFFCTLASTSGATELSQTNDSFWCSFHEFSAGKVLKAPVDKISTLKRADAILEVHRGETTSRNRAMDGSVRATNGRYWYKLKSRQTVVYASDDGDLLSINPASGLASLSYSSASTGYTFVFAGGCLADD